jgi:hypothetical protein
MSDTRVPDTIPKFNDYVNNTDDRLQTVNPGTTNKYGIDYGFTPAELADWNTRRVNWREVLYPKYTNPATSTTVVKHDVQDFMSSFRAFSEPLLNKIAVSSIAGNTEEEIFNIDLELDTPTRTAVMRQEPGFQFEPSTHGVHNFRFLNPIDPSTQAMPKGQKVMIERFVGEAGLDMRAINFGNAQVTARFLHQVDYPETDTGKTAYYRVAYVNTRGEKGPESAVFSKVIS